MHPIHPHGLLLTGGSSTRLGQDKALIEIDGAPVALTVARVLQQVASPVLAVGREAGTGLTTITDPLEGPLVAFTSGARALSEMGSSSAIILLACDLPFITRPLLELIAGSLDGVDAVIPMANGRPQPLAACYGPMAIATAHALVASGARRMVDLAAAVVVRSLAEPEWLRLAAPAALFDIDTPADLERAVRIAGP